MTGMQINPGIGVPGVSIGDRRARVEASLGAPTTERDGTAYYEEATPPLSIHYDADGAVELIEVAYAGDGGEEAFLGDIQLTHRAMEDVVADLSTGGFAGRRSDIGYDYDAGFAIWSMESITTADLPGAQDDPDHGRTVVEGVSVAPSQYFAG
jgi:hypothetical protein